MNVLLAAFRDDVSMLELLLEKLAPDRLYVVTTSEGAEVVSRVWKRRQPSDSDSLRVYTVKDNAAGFMEFYEVADAWMDELLNLPREVPIYVSMGPRTNPTSTEPLEYIVNALGSNLIAARENLRVVEVSAEHQLIEHYPLRRD